MGSTTTWQRWTCTTLTPARKTSTRFAYTGVTEGWVDLITVLTVDWADTIKDNQYFISRKQRQKKHRTSRLRYLIARLSDLLARLIRRVVVVLEVFLQHFEVSRPEHKPFSAWKAQVTGCSGAGSKLGEIQCSGPKELLGRRWTSVTGCGLH